MMNSICEQVQQKLMDRPDAALTDEERRHLAACSACSEVAENVGAVSPGLALIAREVEACTPVRPPAELKGHVRARLKATPLADRSTRQAPQRRRPAGRLAEMFAGIASSRRGLAGAMAAAALVAVVAIGLTRAAKHQPIGRLEFATGPVAIHQASDVRKHQGAGRWTYRRTATIESPSEAMGIFSLGDQVRGALASQTTLAIADRSHIEIIHGAVWLRVLPQRSDFVVQSPHGTVRVGGTSFGLAVGDRETRIDVAGGVILVAQAGRQVEVSAGQTLRLHASGIETPTPRPEGERLPGWVEELLAKEKAAHAGRYVPSLRE